MYRRFYVSQKSLKSLDRRDHNYFSGQVHKIWTEFFDFNFETCKNCIIIDDY